MKRRRHRTERGAGFAARFRSAQGWIAGFSLTVVVLIAVVDVERTSPGPLASVHGLVEELEGGQSCSSCHGGVFSGMTDSCLECHAVIEDQLDGGHGLHGILEDADAQRCALCHSEHHGAGFALVNRQSFLRAGIEDPESFDHELIGFAMDGRHLELSCSECHANADVEVLPAGEHRFLGLAPSCVRCHDDPHEGRMVRGCAECHDQSSFDDLHSVGHEEHLPLVGGHRGVDCRSCHAEDAERSLEALARGLRGKNPRACAACHESPHTEEFLQGVGRSVGRWPGATCGTCHVEEHTSFLGDGSPEVVPATAEDVQALRRTLPEQMTPKLHAASGFPLDAPHDATDCTSCHDTAHADFDARFPGRDADSCSVCHEDPHGGQFETGLFAGQECTACHARVHFDPPAFDVEAHARTAFPLEGTHVTTDCASCHLAPPGEPRLFHGTASRCEDCHADAHEGFFDAGLETLAEPSAAGTCAECHLSTSFDDVLLEAAHPDTTEASDVFSRRPFDHAEWTAFPIRGAHEQGGCLACHPRADAPDDTGRRFGRVTEHFGTHEGCTTCHLDPHAGGFDKHALPARFQGQRGCLRCHVETSFRTLPHGFDHELWTGFELDGAHLAADCSACHAPLRRPDERGRTWDHAVGSNCGDCHADPHAGQFDVAGTTDCASCHRSAEGFDVLRFDHERHSRFPLGEAHSQVACSSCHVAWELESGQEIVRYRPLETSCSSCHGSQEGPTLRRRGRRD